MDFNLSETEEMARAVTREFAEGEIAPLAQEIDASEGIPEGLRRKLRENNYFSLLIPEEYGGAGFSTVGYVAVMEELSRASASVAITVSVHNSVAAGPILTFGSEAQKRAWLPLLAERFLGAFALTEPESGSDAASLSTRAVRSGEHYVLDGTKTFITNGRFADLFLIMARTGPDPGHRGISAFVVERDSPGLTVGKAIDKMGIRGSDTVEIALEGCRVPAANLLVAEGAGFKVAMQSLDAGRIGVAAQGVGIAQAALEAAVRYAGERSQFGKPIGELQAIQWMIAEMKASIDGARLLTYRAAWLKDEGLPFGAEAAMAKLVGSRTSREVSDMALQIHGGYGYTKEFAVERFYRDAKVTELYEGTSEIQRLVIARAVLGVRVARPGS